MPELFAPSIDEQIAAVERELHMRARVYPRLVANQKMMQRVADREMAAMQAVLETLKRVKAAT